MLKKIILIYFFCSFLICDNTFKVEAFRKYSIKKIDYQYSNYSFSLTKSYESPINYSFSWLPTYNFIIDTKLISNFKNDNKLFYAFNFGFLFNKNNIVGLSINALKFDNTYDDVRWNSYFFINAIKYHNWVINTNLSFNFNKNFSFFNISNFFENKFLKYFDIGLGFNFTKIEQFIITPYFGIQYNL